MTRLRMFPGGKSLFRDQLCGVGKPQFAGSADAGCGQERCFDTNSKQRQRVSNGKELAEAIAGGGQLVKVAVLGKPYVADLVGLRGIVVKREPRLARRYGEGFCLNDAG